MTFNNVKPQHEIQGTTLQNWTTRPGQSYQTDQSQCKHPQHHLQRDCSLHLTIVLLTIQPNAPEAGAFSATKQTTSQQTAQPLPSAPDTQLPLLPPVHPPRANTPSLRAPNGKQYCFNFSCLSCKFSFSCSHFHGCSLCNDTNHGTTSLA